MRMKDLSLRLTSISSGPETQGPQDAKGDTESSEHMNVAKKRKKSGFKIKVEDQQNLAIINFLSMHSAPCRDPRRYNLLLPGR